MFGNFLKKATQKANGTIDRTAGDIGEVVKKADKLIETGQGKLNLVTTLSIVGIVLGITADIISIAVGVRTFGLLKVKGLAQVKRR